MIDKVKSLFSGNPTEKLADEVLKGHPLKTEMDRLVGNTDASSSHDKNIGSDDSKGQDKNKASEHRAERDDARLSLEETQEKLNAKDSSMKEKVKEKLQDAFEPEADLKHKNYEYVENEEDADGVAWVLVNHHKLKKYPFNFPTLQPNECRVEILYSSICHSDCSFTEEYWMPHKFPFCPGHEVLGRITQAGSEVKDLKVGDRVGLCQFRKSCGECVPCKRGQENICVGNVDQKLIYGDLYWGGLATHIQQPCDWIFKIPESIPDDKAAPLMCSGVTAYSPLAYVAKPGDKIAVIGMGGVGHMAIKIAKAMGYEVTAFTSNEDKLDAAKNVGADRAVKMTHETLKEETMKHDVVLNTSAAVYDNFSEILAITAPLGSFIQIGIPAVTDLIKVPGILLVLHRISLQGSLTGSKKEHREMLEFCAKHNVLPECKFYEFDEVPDAFYQVNKGNPIFKNVIKVKDYVRKQKI